MEAHEAHETIHEAALHDEHHGGHDAGPIKSSRNKKIAVLISVLAMLLAIVEAGGKSAQNASLSANINANDLWTFYQAKTIRLTTLQSSADLLELAVPGEAAARKVAEWRAAVQRYDSDPASGDGRKELMTKAKAAEAARDTALSAYHMFEYGAAALQISIVLCSAAVVTGVIGLAIGAGGLGLLGVVFALLGWLAPTLIHL